MAGEIWPRLRKKLQRLKSKSSKKPNPYASIGLEKFASLLEEIRSKQQAATSIVERTASTLSAARSISRSAQEWTASTLVRTIHDTTTGAKPSPGGTPIVAGEPLRDEESKQQSQPALCESEVEKEPVKSFASSPLDLLKKTASSPLDLLKKTASSPLDLLKKTAATPLGLRLPVTRCRLMTSKSAFVLGFVALGTFLSSRAGKVGRALFAALSFSAVIRNWRKWKYSARFLLSSVALYFLFPLRGYLSTRMPEASQLILPPSHESEVVLLEEPALISPPLPIPENRPASEIEHLPRQARVSLPRRVAKKISSQFKNLKPRMFRSSSPSSHHRLKKCPLARKASDITSESTRSLQRKCKIVMRRQDSSEITSKSATLEHCSHHRDSIASELSSSRVDHHQYEGNVAWPLVGLLVTLLFLLVGRVPAIMATSFSFVVVSPHSRARAGSRRGSIPDHR